LHFHALRELAPEWAAREPRRFPHELRPMPVEEAVEAFDAPHDSLDYRIAIARLAHAAAVSPSDALQSHLKRAVARLPGKHAQAVQTSMRGVAPHHVFGRVERALRMASRPEDDCLHEGPPPAMEVSAQYNWARVERQVTVNRSISKFKGAGDPRQWQVVAPETFLQSKPLDGGAPPKFMLLEEAQWAPSGSVMSNYQNHLEIEYVAHARGGMDLRYSLYKSLSMSVPPFYSGPGGLSIDSGEARIFEARRGYTTIVASKKLRHVFPNDDNVAIVLNYLSLAAIAVLMDRFVVGGACP